MENVRNRMLVRIVRTTKMMLKLISKQTYQKRKLLDEDLAVVFSKNENITLNKPIFGGANILDLSKLLMFKFYVKLKEKYGDKMKLLATDTDSFMLHIETEDVYEDMKKERELFDTSDYVDNFPVKDLKSNENKKIPGKFKDEYNGIPIREFCGLRSKMYAY